MLLNKLLTGKLLPSSLLREMQDAIVLGGPMQGRPWASPGYGLGLMIGGTKSGHMLAGHTGVGPGGVIAVFHYSSGNNAVTCSVFRDGSDDGGVEAEVLQRLLAAVGTCEER